MTEKVLIYLHGFLSSPQSHKASLVADYMATHARHIRMECPQLANFPEQALAQARALASQYKDAELAFIGSSMGGFLATHLVNEFGGRAVLINPAVNPHILLSGLLGQHQNPYTQEQFTLDGQHVKQLQALAVQGIKQPDAFWVLLQQGDETLDYRWAEQLYQHGHLSIEANGSHAFDGFERYLPQIVDFLFNDKTVCTVPDAGIAPLTLS
ncbi:esterase YqiA [Bowmanella denitrificans]|uniref:Esterase YqiA n=1 Tax=Bowmanella denitrificans TaxID=366582 RepID=A0ABP3H3K8_9ALTE